MKFKKITAIAATMLLTGLSLGHAFAMSPTDSPFDAVVYGANAATSDKVAADSIATWLDLDAATTSTTSGGEGVNENEVPLQGLLNVSGSKIVTRLTDSKIDSLLDTKLSWDDGGSSGADDYNIHEEIMVGDMAINTTFQDNDYAELVALTNDKALKYRYVFDDAMNCSGISSTNTLKIDFLGKPIEIQALTNTTVTVTLASERSMGVGDSYTDPDTGKNVVISGIFSSSVEATVDGVSAIVSETGGADTVNGIKIDVTGIGYNSNAPETSVAIVKIGDEISKTYSSGEEYIGEDEDDPLWVWDISTACFASGYIGVKYNHKETRDTDDVVYEGGSYVLPEDFAAVKFNGLTSVNYEDFKIYFDSSEDLWNNTDLTSTAQTLDAPVLVVESMDGTKDAITLTTGSQETSKMYLRWATSTTETQGTQANASLEVFYSDVDGTVQTAVRPRFSVAYPSTTNQTGTIANTDLGDIIVGDTTIAMHASVIAGNLVLNFTDGGAGQRFAVDLGGDAILNHSTGNLKWFGGNTEATSKETAEATDMTVATTNVGTYDYDIMTSQGIIIKTPESNLDDDVVVFSVPSDRVYADVSVLTGISTSTTTSGSMVFKDSEKTSWQSKNVILVGGSCINTATATALGVPSGTCGDDFEAATGAGSGQYIIEVIGDKFTSGKLAMVVAGYNADDTTAAASYLKSNEAKAIKIEATDGNKYFSADTSTVTKVA